MDKHDRDEMVAKQKDVNLRQYLMTRRRFLRDAAVAMGSVACAPFLSGAHNAFAKPGKPLTFVGWQYHPEIVEENVGIFRKLYDEDVSYELVPGEYHAVAETKLIGGQHIDMLYSEEDHIMRWFKAKWARPIEDLSGIPEIKKEMYDVNVNNMSLPDGRLMGLPYYTGFNSFVYNDLHMQKAKLKPPQSWEELIEQCRELKANKISEYPYISAWAREWPSLSWSLFAVWYSEGEPVFDKDFNPTFKDGGVAFKKVLEMHKQMYDEKLVRPDIMTMKIEGVPDFSTGQHTFMVVHEYDQKVFNDPNQSQLAGHCKNALMPGKTHSTFIWTAVYLMGANPVDVERAWNLMQFFGGKAKDGQYHVAKKWALNFGLGTPHKEVINDPEVQADFKKWKDTEIANKQHEIATTRDVAKTMWFPEWDWYMMGQVHDYIRGKLTIKECIDSLYKKAVELKKLYPV